jgi:hypothetical protein
VWKALSNLLEKLSSMEKRLSDSWVIVVRAVGEVLFLYGLLGWMYGVITDLTHPEWLPTQLSHLTPWIRVDTFTIISFLLSALGFFMWRLAKESAHSQ